MSDGEVVRCLFEDSITVPIEVPSRDREKYAVNLMRERAKGLCAVHLIYLSTVCSSEVGTDIISTFIFEFNTQEDFLRFKLLFSNRLDDMVKLNV